MVIRLADCHTPDALTYQSFIIDVALSRLKAKMHISARPIAEASVLHDKTKRQRILRNLVLAGKSNLLGGEIPKTVFPIPQLAIGANIAHREAILEAFGIALKCYLI